jgi:hypothetical protein
MTTKANGSARTLVRQLSIVLGVWFVGVALVTPVMPLTRTVIAFGSPAKLIEALDAGESRLLAGGARSIVVSAPDAKAVRSLYAQGAFLVLPATRGGCNGLVRWLERAALPHGLGAV